MKKNINIAAVILAGGRGERMGTNFKQFLKIDGKPLIFYSLEKFIKCTFVNRIMIVVPKKKVAYAKKIIYKKFTDPRIKIIVGGKTRRWSAYNALQHLNDSRFEADYVIFHDANRPLISIQMIKTVIEEAKKWGGAVVAAKAIDLIFEADNDFIFQVFDKKKTYCGYTPQCFRFDWIWQASIKTKRIKSLDSADNIELIKRVDKKKKIKIIDKFYPNPKLTFKADLKILKPFLKN